jgi:hypothetical protein
VLITRRPAPSKKSLRAIATEPKNNAKTTDTNKNLIEPNWLMRPSSGFLSASTTIFEHNGSRDETSSSG